MAGLFIATSLTACKEGLTIKPNTPTPPPSNPGWRIGATEAAPDTTAKDVPKLKL